MIDEERPAGSDPFARTASATRLALPQVLAIHDDTDLSYFDPIFELHLQRKIETVVTLNYDLTLETAAARRGATVARGVEAWSERTALSFRPGELRRLKLHGSIDWIRQVSDRHRHESDDADRPPDDEEPVEPARLRYPREWIEEADEPLDGREPHLIFGEGSKLQIEGPFLDLLTQFRAELDRVDALVIVGYSFGDAHVNAYIRKWLAADASRRLHVIDPGFGGSSAARRTGRSRTSFGWTGMGSEVDLRELLLRDSDGEGQVSIHRATARSGLRGVLELFN